MRKYLWIIIGLVLFGINLIFNLLLVNNFFEGAKEGGLIVFAIAGLLGLPCTIVGTSGTLCWIIDSFVWFGIGALVGWLISRNTILRK